MAGLTAFPVALVAPVTRISAAGFSAQGAAWLVLLVLGIVYIRRKQALRARMLMLAAVTSGAVFFRVYLALWAIFRLAALVWNGSMRSMLDRVAHPVGDHGISARAGWRF